MAGSIRRRGAVTAIAALTMLLQSLAIGYVARAQEFPARPVHILVPFAAGGAVDIVARTLADELGKRWPVNIIVENRPGAGGTIAAEVTAKSPPDGYTLAVMAGGHAIVPFLYPKLAYDIFTDFTTISLLGATPNLLLVRADSSIKTIADLIALARAKPGQLSYGHAGNGTSQHLAMELLKATARIDITSIPYKGGGPALNDLLGGHIPVSVNNVPEAIAQIKAGTVRALAVTTATRSSLLPQVPTVAESGLPDYDTGAWWALFGPAGLPAAVKAKINRDTVEAMKAPALKARFEVLGATPLGSTPEALAALIRRDYDKWGPIIKSIGIRGE